MDDSGEREYNCRRKDLEKVRGNGIQNLQAPLWPPQVQGLL